MSLRTTIRNLVGVAFSAIGDLAETITYTQPRNDATYDDVTGTVDQGTLTVITPRAVFEAADSKQEPDLSALQQQAVSGDQFVYIPGIDLTVTPTTRDTFVRADGLTWLVKGMQHDPARGLWILLASRESSVTQP